MANSNTSVKANIIEEVPADRTTSADSPNNDLQEMDRGEDNRRAQKIYYIQNYYTNSFNNHKFQRRNCDNYNNRRTTVIDHASNDVDERPYPQPDEAFSGPLVPSDISIPNTRRSTSDGPPTRSLFFGIRNSEQPSPPSPNSGLVLPSTSILHISIPMHHIVLFSSAVLFCLVYFLIALHKWI
ncbi:hypothetical protein BYT27DRAFT_7192207 [Phlegmacium glaucopus]|nr:hypothetical protein BYT27DRAFT_7192207 [Phlegmacium glaucopus]